MNDKTEYFESQDIYNNYGSLGIYKQDEKYYIQLEDWKMPAKKEISKGLYDMLKTEVCCEKY